MKVKALKDAINITKDKVYVGQIVDQFAGSPGSKLLMVVCNDIGKWSTYDLSLFVGVVD